MKTFLKYLFVSISLYLMLKFAVDNPKKVSDIKDFVDLNTDKAIDATQKLFEQTAK